VCKRKLPRANVFGTESRGGQQLLQTLTVQDGLAVACEKSANIRTRIFV
jgi:hypothetical protein